MTKQRQNQQQNRLQQLLQTAMLNQQKLTHIQNMELRLLDAQSLVDLLHVLIYDYRLEFNLCAVTLNLADKEAEIEQLIKSASRDKAYADKARLVKSRLFLTGDYKNLASSPHHVVLTELTEHHEMLFGNFAEDIESVAIIPLRRGGERLGFLCLGSVDPNRYHPDLEIDFLARLGSIVSVCLQNVLQLERLKQYTEIESDSGLFNRRGLENWFVRNIDPTESDGEALLALRIELDNKQSQQQQLARLREMFKPVASEQQILCQLNENLLFFVKKTANLAKAHGVASRYSNKLAALKKQAFSQLDVGKAVLEPAQNIAEANVMIDNLLNLSLEQKL